MKALLLIASPLLALLMPSFQATMDATADPQPANSTLWTDVYPPARFQGEAQVTVSFLTPEHVREVCAGTPPPGKVIVACARKNMLGVAYLILPTPESTDAPYFRQIVAHEIGHLHGWPDTHGD